MEFVEDWLESFQEMFCCVQRPVLPLYVKSRHLIRAAPIFASCAARDARQWLHEAPCNVVGSISVLSLEAFLGQTWAVLESVCEGCMRLRRRLRRSARGALRGDPYYRLIVALSFPVPVAIMYKSFEYVLSINEAVWQELSAVYDTNNDTRYDAAEVSNVFRAPPAAQDGFCMPQHLASRWVHYVDQDGDGVDRHELLSMYEQIPKPFLTPYVAERMERLVRYGWYLRAAQAFFVMLSVILTVLSIKWLYKEVSTRRKLAKQLEAAAGVQDGFQKEAQELQREVSHQRQRLARANRELARLSEERQKAVEEQRAAEAELVHRENLLSMLIDPMEETPSRSERCVRYLYASPLMYVTPKGVPVLVEPLRIDDEFKMLRNALMKGGAGPDLHADLATPNQLLEVLLSDIPGQCIHVSCHGDENCLQLEGRSGSLEVLPLAVLRKWLSRTPLSCAPEVVVLLCCKSVGVGRVLLEAGVRRVVCTCGQLPDKTARQFTEAFWSCLANPASTVDEAFQRALVLLRSHGAETACGAALLMLLPDSPQLARANSGRRSLKQPRAVRRPRQQRELESPHLSALPEDFVGREFLLCKVLSILECRGREPRRVVCAYGVPGIGKSAFATFLARFVHTPGRLFNGGVLYDPSWRHRTEPLPWLWLEAAWRLLGVESWEYEASGLTPDCNTGDLLENLCVQLRRGNTGNARVQRLLIVDDVDRFPSEFDIQGALDTLLERRNLSILLTARQPWHKDIHGFKVLDIELPKLDGLSSAKLFLRRVRRPLHRGDFEEPGRETDGSSPSPAAWCPEVGACPLQASLTALLQHPLHRLLDGHPKRIRETAEKVTDRLASLHDLVNDLAAEVDRGKK
eukprot:TRINITY_DN29749_c0_g1_i2.p1 TRINITY_DN29749_c0_g1~~TRINITY_DN29749_c0_g1_i2.p1  ORF type:complete len:859 (+),score=191.73 TRINITY_DN29749_c0_g1_i2:90-2666(+)